MTKKIKAGAPAILKDKGSEYSEVANEVERTYRQWLTAGQWQEAALLTGINCDSFQLSYEQTLQEIKVELKNDEGVLCVPLLWVQGLSPLTEAEFKLDCALLLMYITAREITPASVERIKSFVRTFLL